MTYAHPNNFGMDAWVSAWKSFNKRTMELMVFRSEIVIVTSSLITSLALLSVIEVTSFSWKVNGKMPEFSYSQTGLIDGDTWITQPTITMISVCIIAHQHDIHQSVCGGSVFYVLNWVVWTICVNIFTKFLEWFTDIIISGCTWSTIKHCIIPFISTN